MFIQFNKKITDSHKTGILDNVKGIRLKENTLLWYCH